MYSGEPLFVFLTGASGAGKTHLAELLNDRLDHEKAEIAFFDSIGVPSLDEMLRQYGSGEGWQKAKTYEWIEKLLAIADKPLRILEGSSDPQFIIDCCKRVGITNYLLCVVHCDDGVREERLTKKRNQPGLVKQDMRNWAKVLHDKTLTLGGSVIDTSDSSSKRYVNELASLINDRLITKNH